MYIYIYIYIYISIFIYLYLYITYRRSSGGRPSQRMQHAAQGREEERQRGVHERSTLTVHAENEC